MRRHLQIALAIASIVRRGLLLIAAAAVGFATPAQGVVIVTADGSGNTSAPPNFPEWNNVGVCGASTAVYLGDTWVITAAHVGVNSVILPSGTFGVQSGSAVQLTNPSGQGLTSATDLLMFRLTDNPGLPTLSIPDLRPSAGTRVTMIGHGDNRALTQTGWDIKQFGANVIWTPTLLTLANAVGYATADTRTMRWGTNSITGASDVSTKVSGNDLLALTTTFDKPVALFSTNTYEAQAVQGDSGGAVFATIGGKTELVGIMNAIQTNTGQPDHTAVFGDDTLVADLAAYRSEILQIMSIPPPSLKNPANPVDVNGDGRVQTIDALIVINGINLHIRSLKGLTGPPYYDVNGDGDLTLLDALMVINALNSKPASAAATALAVVPSLAVPEPSTLALVGSAVVLCVLSLVQRAQLKRIKILRSSTRHSP